MIIELKKYNQLGRFKQILKSRILNQECLICGAKEVRFHWNINLPEDNSHYYPKLIEFFETEANVDRLDCCRLPFCYRCFQSYISEGEELAAEFIVPNIEDKL